MLAQTLMLLTTFGFEVKSALTISNINLGFTTSTLEDGRVGLMARGLERNHAATSGRLPPRLGDELRGRSLIPTHDGPKLALENGLDKIKVDLERLKLRNKGHELQNQKPEQIVNGRVREEREELQRLMLDPDGLKNTKGKHPAEKSRRGQNLRLAMLRKKYPEEARHFEMQNLLRRKPHGLKKEETERLDTLRKEFTAKAEGQWLREKEEREELKRLMLQSDGLESTKGNRLATLRKKYPEEAKHFEMQSLLRQKPWRLSTAETERLDKLRNEFTAKALGQLSSPSSKSPHQLRPSRVLEPPLSPEAVREDPWQQEKLRSLYRSRLAQTTRPPPQLVANRGHDETHSAAASRPHADLDVRRYAPALNGYLNRAPAHSPQHHSRSDHGSSSAGNGHANGRLHPQRSQTEEEFWSWCRKLPDCVIKQYMREQQLSGGSSK